MTDKLKELREELILEIIKEERNKLLKQKENAHKKAVELIIDNILIMAIDEDYIFGVRKF